MSLKRAMLSSFVAFSIIALIFIAGDRNKTKQKPSEPPRPVCFCFFGDKLLVGDPYFGRVPNELRSHGWIIVSLDLPCHGDDKRPGEPEELSGWNYRLNHGEDIFKKLCDKASKCLDELESTRNIDRSRICVYGISRGGFMAVEWISRDHRISKAATMCQVFRLRDPGLAEFDGKDQSLSDISDKITCPVSCWVAKNDPRVGNYNPSFAEIHVMPVNEHHVTNEAFKEAANWLEK